MSDVPTHVRFETRLIRSLQTWIFAVVALLVFAGLAGHGVRYALGLEPVGAFGFFYHQFNLSNEDNLPAWFSSLQLGLCALVLLAIGACDDLRVQVCRRQWFILAVAFLLLSFDEDASLHERLIDPVHRIVGESRWLTNAWVFAVLPMVGLLGLYMLALLKSLPPRTRNLFLISGAIYVGGAAGVELVSGAMRFQYGISGAHFAFSSWFEEALELIGIALFLKAASDWLVTVSAPP